MLKMFLMTSLTRTNIFQTNAYLNILSFFSNIYQFSSVQWLRHVQLFMTPWIAARQASLSITNSRSSLRLMSIVSAMPSNHFILCRPLLLLPPIPPSIRVFSNESTLRMRWPKYWSFRKLRTSLRKLLNSKSLLEDSEFTISSRGSSQSIHDGFMQKKKKKKLIWCPCRETYKSNSKGAMKIKCISLET